MYLKASLVSGAVLSSAVAVLRKVAGVVQIVVKDDSLAFRAKSANDAAGIEFSFSKHFFNEFQVDVHDNRPLWLSAKNLLIAFSRAKVACFDYNTVHLNWTGHEFRVIYFNDDMCLSRTYQLAAEEAGCPNSALEELLRSHRWKRKSVLAYNANDLRSRLNRVAQTDRGPNNRIHLIVPSARDRRIDTSSPIRAASQALDPESIITWVAREANLTEARDEGDTKSLVHHYFDTDVDRAMRRQPHTIGVIAPPLAAFVQFAAKYNEQVWLCIRGGRQPLVCRTGHEARLNERGEHGSLSSDFGMLDEVAEWSDATRASNYCGCLVLAPKNFLPNLNEDVTSILLAPELQVDSESEEEWDQPTSVSRPQPATSLSRIQPASSVSRIQPASSVSRAQPASSVSRVQPASSSPQVAEEASRPPASSSVRKMPPPSPEAQLRMPSQKPPMEIGPDLGQPATGTMSQAERETLLQSQRMMQAPDFLTQGMDELCATLPLPASTDLVTPAAAVDVAEEEEEEEDEDDARSECAAGRVSISSVEDVGFSIAISQDEALRAQAADEKLLAEMNDRLRQSIAFELPADSQDWV